MGGSGGWIDFSFHQLSRPPWHSREELGPCAAYAGIISDIILVVLLLSGGSIGIGHRINPLFRLMSCIKTFESASSALFAGKTSLLLQWLRLQHGIQLVMCGS